MKKYIVINYYSQLWSMVDFGDINSKGGGGRIGLPLHIYHNDCIKTRDCWVGSDT